MVLSPPFHKHGTAAVVMEKNLTERKVKVLRFYFDLMVHLSNISVKKSTPSLNNILYIFVVLKDSLEWSRYPVAQLRVEVPNQRNIQSALISLR